MRHERVLPLVAFTEWAEKSRKVKCIRPDAFLSYSMHFIISKCLLIGSRSRMSEALR
jgi:hypothetical protein